MFLTTSPLLVFLGCALFQGGEIRIEGLNADESFVELAPAREPLEERDSFRNYGQVSYIYGRVVDAFTRQPIEGAVIETWTEELNPHAGGFQRIGESISASDGRFRVRNDEKARIHADGYLTLSVSAGELWDTSTLLFPADDHVPELRVIDTTGKPIFNAVITSSYSCSHDLPAFEARTDSHGTVRLPGFGIQDKIQDLRIRASGYAGTEYLWGEPALLGLGPLTVVMPRQDRRLEMQLLRRDGSPAAFEALHIIDGECYHVGLTSDYGHLRLPYRFLSEYLTINPVDKIDGYRWIASLDLIPDHRVVLRLDPGRWDDVEVGKIRITAPPENHLDEHRADGTLFHQNGWMRGINGRSIPQVEAMEFPVGRTFLHIGGGFQPYAEEWIQLDLKPNHEVDVKPNWQPQPQFTVKFPEGDFSPLWIEAAGFSTEINKGQNEFYYPEGARVVLCAKWKDQTRFWEYNRPKGETTLLDWRELHLVPPLPTADDVAKHEVDIRLDPSISEQGSVSLDHPTLRLEDNVVTEIGPGHYRATVPELGPILGTWSGEDYLDANFKIYPGQTKQIKLAPMQAAKLEINCDQEYENASNGSITHLHPGPTDVVLQLEDGRRIGLKVNLASGEQRKITVLTK